MMMMSDIQVRDDVLRELKWDPRIQVSVNCGFITLTGTVGSFAELLTAQEAAQRVSTVHPVTNDLRVETPAGARTDAEIAEAVRHALLWDRLLPEDRIQSTVCNGWVGLKGSVDFLHEREDAERLVSRMTGVRGVYNQIVVDPPEVYPENVREAIGETLKRHAESEAESIQVSLKEGTVTLSGRVNSWEEERAVVCAAGHVPGIQKVNDRLSIDPGF